MKKLLLVMSLVASVNVFASEDYSNAEFDFTRTYAQCASSCSHYAYNFQSSFRGKCEQVVRCTERLWNEDINACQILSKNTARTYIIECRDIPPVL